MNILERISNWIHSEEIFVIIDPNDNSVTLSQRLFKHMTMHANEPKVFVFKITGSEEFAFMAEPGKTIPASAMCDIQYNDKHKCIGFETLRPSAGRILYEYGLPADKPIKLSVTIKRTKVDTGNGKTQKHYYKIDAPKKTR